uniref:BAC19.16 n=1 Tax=Solanum lycopersicum TaxID=4081 RepID=Q9FYW0_SOLLC|nr:BAC19.16 [Solanum lycopersicum]
MNRYWYTGTKPQFRPVLYTGSDYPVPYATETGRTGTVPLTAKDIIPKEQMENFGKST